MSAVECISCHTTSSVAFYRQPDNSFLCNSCNWLAFEKRTATISGYQKFELPVESEIVESSGGRSTPIDNLKAHQTQGSVLASKLGVRTSARISTAATAAAVAAAEKAEREKRASILPRRAAGIPKGKGRRAMFKNSQRVRPARIVHAEAGMVTVDWCFSRAQVWHRGDIVSLRDADSGEIFYAQITGLVKQPDLTYASTVTWLLPLRNYDITELRRRFDPEAFVLGPCEEYARPLDQMEFICHAPHDYYTPHTGPFATQGSLTDCVLTSIRPKFTGQQSNAEVFGI